MINDVKLVIFSFDAHVHYGAARAVNKQPEIIGAIIVIAVTVLVVVDSLQQ